MELQAMRQAERAMAAEETAAAVRGLVEGMGMGQYLPLLGKKKNERVFWVSYLLQPFSLSTQTSTYRVSGVRV
eukprot:COSAG02_NODE_2075_length_9928_cov_9.770272_2_plen_73_part_00